MLIIWYLQKTDLPDHQLFLHICDDLCFDSGYHHLFKEPVALCNNSLFSSVRPEPLILKFCFSSNLTVIAV